ncbi:DUF4352 domain-containing protein [Nocardia fluminea]|uniref:DUF4352 domain-containing protein n=1 Tax=Nocardia fluminea TaxID=134984 RepID=A0A2N3WYF7_9NOCA|nr:DUF4352 domain-containing protein [Nocardia fluminea]PKV98889.1 hypothetical protein ATK86_0919 [Nocardia fluminea]
MRKSLIIAYVAAAPLIACSAQDNATPPPPTTTQRLGYPTTAMGQWLDTPTKAGGTVKVRASDWHQVAPSADVPGTARWQVFIDLDATGATYDYNELLFLAQTPDGDEYEAEYTAPDNPLGSGTVSGEKRRGNVVIDIPVGAPVNKLVLDNNWGEHVGAWIIP